MFVRAASRRGRDHLASLGESFSSKLSFVAPFAGEMHDIHICSAKILRQTHCFRQPYAFAGMIFKSGVSNNAIVLFKNGERHFKRQIVIFVPQSYFQRFRLVLLVSHVRQRAKRRFSLVNTMRTIKENQFVVLKSLHLHKTRSAIRKICERH